MPPFHLRFGRIFACLFLTSGCSVNGLGFVERKLIAADGAVIERVRATGIHIETEREVFALSFGVYDHMRVFSLACMAPVPRFQAQRPELSFRQMRGASVHFNSGEAELALGISESLRMRPVAPDESGFRKIVFEPGAPDATLLKYLTEDHCNERSSSD